MIRSPLRSEVLCPRSEAITPSQRFFLGGLLFGGGFAAVLYVQAQRMREEAEIGRDMAEQMRLKAEAARKALEAAKQKGDQ